MQEWLIFWWWVVDFHGEVAEGVELVVGCVVRLVRWCVNERGYFLIFFFFFKP